MTVLKTSKVIEYSLEHHRSEELSKWVLGISDKHLLIPLNLNDNDSKINNLAAGYHQIFNPILRFRTAIYPISLELCKKSKSIYHSLGSWGCALLDLLARSHNSWPEN